MRRAALALGIAALAGGCASDDEETRRATVSPLVKQLRAGGHVVALRHAATDSGMDTTNDLSDCSKQRNLDAEGRRQSRDIGRAFDRLGIPVGRVLASPFCRSRDTARVAFGRVRLARGLLGEEFFASPKEARRKGLRSLLAAPEDTNTVLVSHGSAIDAATGVNPEEGEAVIIRPSGGKPPFEVVATVKAERWSRLAGD